MIQQRLHVSGWPGPIVAVRFRDYLAKLDAGCAPTFRLVRITKIERRARAVQNHQLAKLNSALDHMTQRRSQRRYSSTHSDEHQILTMLRIKVETMAGNLQ